MENIEKTNQTIKSEIDNNKSKSKAPPKMNKSIITLLSILGGIASIIGLILTIWFINPDNDDPKIQYEMVFVKGDTCILNESHLGLNGIVDTVVLKDYYIGKYEVTQKEWDEIMGVNPSKWKKRNHPVNNVNLNDISSFLIKLESVTGKKYRLPTEAEWEYAARGGSKTQHYKYSGSNKIPDVAWYRSNSKMKTNPVGKKAPNELGLHDMSGNVWEWCNSLFVVKCTSNNSYCEDYYVLRGGSFGLTEDYCRVSTRDGAPPSFNAYDGGIGFRLVLDVDENSSSY